MANNPGVYPLDPSTLVGQFRLYYGDTDSEPFNPVQPGIQNYTELSDAEIEMFLAQGGGDVTRAIGHYYWRLAGEAAKESKSVKDYDLQVDLTKRAAELRAIAQGYFDQADAADAEEAFFIVPTGRRCEPLAELAERPCGCRGACYCGGW
jgi:hypothetical protein